MYFVLFVCSLLSTQPALMEERKRETCMKVEISGEEEEAIYVKGTWFDTHFNLSITDGFTSWYCNASEEEVKQRAAQWDQPVSEYVLLSQRYLEFQQPASVYAFADAAHDGHKRLSWTFEKRGMMLHWRWKCMQSPDCKKTTVEILDFLMDANIRLSEEVVMKTKLFEKKKLEAEMCLAQRERIANVRVEFESEIYTKFLEVLNSKKAKLRELRDQLSQQDKADKSPQEEDTEKTESFDEESDYDKSDEDPKICVTSSSKNVGANKRARPWKTRLT